MIEWLQVWFQNRRAKFRKQERSGGGGCQPEQQQSQKGGGDRTPSDMAAEDALLNDDKIHGRHIGRDTKVTSNISKYRSSFPSKFVKVLIDLVKISKKSIFIKKLSTFFQFLGINLWIFSWNYEKLWKFSTKVTSNIIKYRSLTLKVSLNGIHGSSVRLDCCSKRWIGQNRSKTIAVFFAWNLKKVINHVM